jgi:hypothetical protein
MADKALETITVTSTTYGADPDVSFGFEADSILVLNRSSTASDEILISFDGADDHGTTVPGLLPAIGWTAKRRAVWLRRASSGSSDVQVMAGTVR